MKAKMTKKKAIRKTKRTIRTINGSVELSLPEPMLIPPTIETSCPASSIISGFDRVQPRYFEVYEQIPINGGDYRRSIVIRDRREDAEEILAVLEKSNILWERYGIREIDGSKPIKLGWWQRFNNWLSRTFRV